jgi:hypothetical protein
VIATRATIETKNRQVVVQNPLNRKADIDIVLLKMIPSVYTIITKETFFSAQVDGFPPADQLKTVYVEHDIQSSDAQVQERRHVYIHA